MTHLGWYGVPPPIALRQLVARVTAGDPLSNGRLEGTNNKIGLVKRMGPTDSSTPKTSPPAAHSSAQAPVHDRPNETCRPFETSAEPGVSPTRWALLGSNASFCARFWAELCGAYPRLASTRERPLGLNREQILSARANLPKPRNTMRGSSGTGSIIPTHRIGVWVTGPA
jgi:hypothetical protein